MRCVASRSRRLASIACAAALGLDADARAGLLLFGCVSGGQASNLCALLGGGDAALSVVLTTSTTLLGCVATPVLASRLLRSTIAVDGGAILASTASLVLAPLGAGVLTAALFPRVAQGVETLLRAGGHRLYLPPRRRRRGGGVRMSSWRAHVGVVAMPLLAAALALALAKTSGLRGAAPRTVAIETLVKSPTLAAVLAREHLGAAAAAVPAAGDDRLAVVGRCGLWPGRVPCPPIDAPPPPPEPARCARNLPRRVVRVVGDEARARSAGAYARPAALLPPGRPGADQLEPALRRRLRGGLGNLPGRVVRVVGRRGGEREGRDAAFARRFVASSRVLAERVVTGLLASILCHLTLPDAQRALGGRRLGCLLRIALPLSAASTAACSARRAPRRRARRFSYITIAFGPPDTRSAYAKLERWHCQRTRQPIPSGLRRPRSRRHTTRMLFWETI